MGRRANERQEAWEAEQRRLRDAEEASRRQRHEDFAAEQAAAEATRVTEAAARRADILATSAQAHIFAAVTMMANLVSSDQVVAHHARIHSQLLMAIAKGQTHGPWAEQ